MFVLDRSQFQGMRNRLAPMVGRGGRFAALSLLMLFGVMLITTACASQPTALPKAAAPTTAPAAKAAESNPTQAATTQTSAGSPKTFKFGVILNLSGSTASQGLQFRQGVELAIELWNKEQGGVDGIPVEGIYEDHANVPSQAVTAAHKLIDVDKVPVFINVNSSPVLAVMPIADQAKVLQVSAGAASPRLVGASKFFLADSANQVLHNDVMLSYARKVLGIERLGVVYRNDDYGNGTVESLVPAWQKLGGTIVISEGHEPNQNEFATLAAKVVAAKPQAVYLASAGPSQGLLVKQLREAGLDVPLLSYVGFEVTEMFSVAQKAAENSFWTVNAQAEDKTRYNAFAEKFRAKYGSDPVTFSALHFDMVTSVLQAATQAKKKGLELNGTNIRQAMLDMGTFLGVLGPITYRPDGTAVVALDMKTVKDGKPVVYLTARQLQEKGVYDFGLK